MATLLSKTSIKFAAARNMFASIDKYDSDLHLLTLGVLNSNGDAELLYLYNAIDGTFHYYGNTWLDPKIKEELPAVIRDEMFLRKVINYIANEI